MWCYLFILLSLWFPCAEVYNLLMTQCIKRICMDNFASSKNLIILTANNISEHIIERKLNLELSDTTNILEQMHYAELFPISIYSSDIHNMKNMKCYLGTVSYLFLLDKPVNNILTNIQLQLQNLKSINCLDRRANYFLAFNNRIAQKDVEVFVKDIFVELRKWNIFNAVIMMFFDSTTNMPEGIINMYTWFPYRGSGACSAVQEIHKINSCYNGELQHNISVFSEKFPKQFHGCPIVAAIVVSALTVQPKKITYENKTEEMEYNDGWELKLWKIVVNSLKLSEIYTISNWTFSKNNSAVGLKDEVLSHRSDVGFGSWPLLWRNLQILDPTVPILSNELIWLVPCAQVHPKWSGIFKMFSISVWILGVIVIHITAAVLSFLAKNSNEIYRSFNECLLNFFAVLLGISVQIMPKKPSLRIVFCSWIIYSLCINTIFQGFLTTFLVQPSFQHQINSIEEILKSRIEFGYSRATASILQNFEDSTSVEIKLKHKHLPHSTEPLNRVAYKRDLCILFSKPFIKFILTKNYLNENGKPLICIADEVFFDLKHVFYLQKGHPLLGRINQKIQRCLETGLMDLIIARDFELQKVRAAVRGTYRFGDDYRNLNTRNLLGVFFILALGNVIALLFFTGEFMYFHFYHK
ncbi:hypothetical protein L9F63_024992 [Diploptera punctata]|uniref:Uncharacterized protein n=1 Tax=Diploptera punctata TaxID=6984 RepID=A0AAD7ZCH0_DIPPU|nr:hypothetical protein L9F63_024992 [Diploptera punctata]